MAAGDGLCRCRTFAPMAAAVQMSVALVAPAGGIAEAPEAASMSQVTFQVFVAKAQDDVTHAVRPL